MLGLRRMAVLMSGVSRPALLLDFLSMTASTFDSRVTFSRGTNATLTDSTGRITYAPNNVVTNSVGPNAGTGTAVATASGAAPNGTNAVRLSKTDATTPRYSNWTTSFTVQANTAYVASAYFKYDGFNTTVSVEYNNTIHFGTGWVATFNVTASGITANSPSNCTSGVQAVGNGWFRVWAAFTSGTPSAPTNPTFLTQITGGAGTSVLVAWGQLEQVTYQTTPSTYVATTSAAYYGPRFDYDPVTRAPRGLQIKEQRTNLLTYSEQFDNAAWSKTASVNPDQLVSPDGTTNADLVSTTGNFQYVRQLITATANAAYTVSFFVKPVSGSTTVRLYLTNGPQTEVAGSNFSLVGAGSLGTLFQIGTGVVTSRTITQLANGWYRCTVSGTVNTTSLYALIDNHNGGAMSFGVWGAQLEQVTYQTTPSTYVATTSAAYYGPLFDYDPVTRAPRGLLIEEQRTNLLTYSEQFDNAAWSKTATVTANTLTSPDGTTNADLVSTVANYDYVRQVITATANAQYTTTFFVKPVSGSTTVRILLTNSTQTEYAGSNFDLTGDGSLGTTFTTGTGVLVSRSITNVGNGWYRCSVTATNNTTSLYALIDNHTGGAMSFGVWGAQLEAGAFATSYIPTVASQVTRTADVATMTGTNFSSWYNQSEGSFVADFTVSQAVTGNYAVFGATAGTATDEIYGYYTATQTLVRVAAGNVQQVNLITAVVNAGNTYKLAAAYKANDFASSLSGGTVVTDTSGTVPTVNQLMIGARNPGSPAILNGHIRTIAYYNTRLPNSQLQTLTAPSLAPTLSLDFVGGNYNIGF